MVFDVTKPETRARLNSEQIRDNFEAVGRASDLKCFAQYPPDRTIYVQPGTYYTVTTSSNHFLGGDTASIDTTTGGLPDQERIVVIEITEFGTLYLNYGSWAIAGSAIPPTYSPSNITLAEVLVTFNDQEIADDQITDVRPLINLGNAGTEIITPELFTTTATEGQITFTITTFTFIPNASELLVWTGGVYQTPVIDYTEPNDHTIQFAVPRPAGERVTIWKVGISATPATMALDDLSDVTSDEADAFHNADAATAINPFLTVSGHAAVDHTALPFYTPIDIHLTSTSTTLPGMKHHASEIEATDNFTFSSATNVQGVLDDIETSIYLKYLIQHKSGGTHGPVVTITNPTTNEALLVTQQSAATAGVRVYQQAAGNALRLEKSSTTSEACLQIFNTGTGDGINLEQRGNGIGLNIHTTSASGSSAVYVNNEAATRAVHIAQYSADPALYINKWHTGAGAPVYIDNQGNDDGVYLNNIGTGNGIRIYNQGNAAQAALFVNNVTTGSGRAVRVDNAGASYTLYLNKTSTTTGDVIQISNAGSGNDVSGNASRWSVDRDGNSKFGNVAVGGGTGVSSGFFTLQQGGNLTIASGQITPTHSYHRVDTGGTGSENLNTINATGVPVGTILILMSVNDARDVVVKDKTGNIDLNGSSDFTLNTTDATLVLMRQTQQEGEAWQWVEISRSAQE